MNTNPILSVITNQFKCDDAHALNLFGRTLTVVLLVAETKALNVYDVRENSLVIRRTPIIDRSISLFGLDIPSDILKVIVSYFDKRSFLHFLSVNKSFREMYLSPFIWNLKSITNGNFSLLNEFKKKRGNAILDLKDTLISDNSIFESLKAFLNNPTAQCINKIEVGSVNAKTIKNIRKLVIFINSNNLLPCLTTFSVESLDKIYSISKLNQLKYFYLGEVCEDILINYEENPNFEEIIINELEGSTVEVNSLSNLKKFIINKFLENSHGDGPDLLFKGNFNKLEILRLGDGIFKHFSCRIWTMPTVFEKLKELHIEVPCSFQAGIFNSKLFPVLEVFSCCEELRESYPDQVTLIESNIQERLNNKQNAK